MVSKRKVIVFRSDLLPRSETFIKQQVVSMTQWCPVLAGYRKVRDGLDLAGIEMRIIPGATSGKVGLCVLRICQWLGLAHRPTVRAFREIGADLVHVHFGTDATDVWPSVKAAGLPMLVTLHGYDINIRREWWQAGHGGFRRRVYPRRLLAMAEDPAVHFVAVSKAIKARAVEFGIPEEKVTVAYIGVDTHRFRPGGLLLEQRRKRILFVGRMVEKKAPLLMIRAFSAVRREVPNAELVMIGGGPLLHEAKRLSSELAAGVTFLGACSSSKVLAQMREARVFCLPSVIAVNGDAEGLPISILEAQACGVPVITSARGAVGEAVIDGDNGLAFEINDLHALTRKLVDLLCNDHLLLRISQRALTTTKEMFSIDETINLLADAYDSLCSTP